jgi:hypothetical protein
VGSALPALNVPSSAAAYSAALEGLVGVDEIILRDNPQLPPLYASGVRYKLKPHRVWRYPHEIIDDGWADCEALTGWRVAELRVSGADRGAKPIVYKTGKRRWHAVVGRSDGWIEDPSIVCGMREHAGMPWTVAEVKERDRTYPRESCVVIGAVDDTFEDIFPSVKVIKHAEGYTGVLKLPTADGVNALIANTSLSKSADEAAAKARNITRDVSAVLAADPYALAELHPASAAAVKVAADPQVQAALRSKGDTSGGLLAQPGNLLERPEVNAIVSQLGPYGAIASAIIANPVARGIRHTSHNVFKHIPLLGRLF